MPRYFYIALAALFVALGAMTTAGLFERPAPFVFWLRAAVASGCLFGLLVAAIGWRRNVRKAAGSAPGIER